MLKNCLLCLLALQFSTMARAAKSFSLNIESIKCESYDLELAKFHQCILNKKPNNQMGWAAKIELLKQIKTIELNAKLFRQVNKKFQPFLYDDTIDLCDFLERKQKRHVFWGMAYKMLLKYSNLNHTCPYENYVIINNFEFDNDVFKVLPLPKGQYKMSFVAILNRAPKFKVDFFVKRT